MKQYISFLKNLKYITVKSYRTLHDKRKINKNSFKYNHLKFMLRNDYFAMIYPNCLVVKLTLDTQLKYKDIVYATTKMKWGIQDNAWNWFEIPISRINSENEQLIYDFIEQSYAITYKKSNINLVQLQNEIVNNRYNEKIILRKILEYKNKKELLVKLNKIEKKSILLSENKNKRASKGCSKLGGNPDLPENFTWPEFNNTPLNFLAQINLSQVYHNISYLPKNGMLYFFAAITNEYEDYCKFVDNMDNKKTVQVFYEENAINLKRKFNKYSSFSQVVLDNIITKSYPQSSEDWNLTENSFTEEEKENICEVADMFYELIDEKLNIKNHHNLLGYARLVQELTPEANDSKYILLFQLSSSENMKMYWGDEGMLYIYIHEDDLKRLDFSNLIIDTQRG